MTREWPFLLLYLYSDFCVFLWYDHEALWAVSREQSSPSVATFRVDKCWDKNRPLLLPMNLLIRHDRAKVDADALCCKTRCGPTTNLFWPLNVFKFHQPDDGAVQCNVWIFHPRWCFQTWPGPENLALSLSVCNVRYIAQVKVGSIAAHTIVEMQSGTGVGASTEYGCMHGYDP